MGRGGGLEQPTSRPPLLTQPPPFGANPLSRLSPTQPGVSGSPKGPPAIPEPQPSPPLRDHDARTGPAAAASSPTSLPRRRRLLERREKRQVLRAAEEARQGRPSRLRLAARRLSSREELRGQKALPSSPGGESPEPRCRGPSSSPPGPGGGLRPAGGARGHGEPPWPRGRRKSASPAALFARNPKRAGRPSKIWPGQGAQLGRGRHSGGGGLPCAGTRLLGGDGGGPPHMPQGPPPIRPPRAAQPPPPAGLRGGRRPSPRAQRHSRLRLLRLGAASRPARPSVPATDRQAGAAPAAAAKSSEASQRRPPPLGRASPRSPPPPPGSSGCRAKDPPARAPTWPAAPARSGRRRHSPPRPASIRALRAALQLPSGRGPKRSGSGQAARH
ncbi:basic salivary proline-rich protein 2-like [Eublepharis macularius]|uniref:Basic salivary proline-rich protein 2-like n=1 Tax=Eublepharis macularius TaxID=481883 RepID=A0AA97LKC1_EUBMA|nr:basic salivary proline-rich protein 2-like [Eublepharis macularius]